MFILIYGITAALLAFTINYLLTYNEFFGSFGGPLPLPIIGNAYILCQASKLPEKLKYLQQRYGKVYGIYLGTIPIVVINDVSVVKEVLSRKFQCFSNRRLKGTTDLPAPFDSMLSKLHGESWHKIKTVVSRLFTPERIDAVVPCMDKAIVNLMATCQFVANNATTCDIFPIFKRYTMETMIYATFGTSTDERLCNEIEDAVKKATRRTKTSTLLTMLPYFLPRFITRLLPNALELRFASLLNLCRDCIKDASLIEKTDTSYFSYLLCSIQTFPHHKKEFTSNDVLAQLLQLLFAGYETASGGLATTAYHLAMNQDIQIKIKHEIKDSMRRNKKHNIDKQVIDELKYLEAVIHESMRLLSPGLLIIRQAAERCNVNGIKISKGMGVAFPVHLIHRDEATYKQPDQFKPERFLSEEPINLYANLTFGRGPRMCVGKKLAMLKMKHCLAYLLLNFTILPNNNEKTELIPEVKSVVQPKQVLVNLIRD